jgi:sn-glycerol 3-phosphate transport system substrate-binding protein
MGGQLNNTVTTIVNEFNKSQSKYKVIPVYKGNYSETLTSTVAAFRAGQQPTLVQVFEVGTETMINPPGVIVPVYKLMQDAHIPLAANSFIPAVHSYYSNSKGQLLAMPFNSSAAVLFYNKNSFTKANIQQPPKTWPQLVTDSKKLLKTGYSCGFTTAWPSWIQIETFSSWQNLPIATDNNGFSGANARMIFNNPTVIHQISELAKWQKQNIFRYGGREDNALALFTSGQCQMLMESSGARGSLVNNLTFNVGTTELPYWPNSKGAPQNAIIGGAAIWALTGKTPVQYHAAAAFFKFLSSPKIQSYWQQQTGYIPVTEAAYKLSMREGYYKKNPGALVPIKELSNKPPKPYTKGLRLGNYSRIRDINCEEIEAALTGIKNPTQAINDAVRRDNQLLQQFEENVKP